MRKYNILNQILKYLAFSIGGLAATLTSATAAPIPSMTPLETTTSPHRIPPEATACIPTGQVVRTELIGTSIYQEKAYYLIAAYNAGGFPSDLVIATQKDRCQRLYYNPSGQDEPFSSNVPEPVARQLNSQRPKY